MTVALQNSRNLSKGLLSTLVRTLSGSRARIIHLTIGAGYQPAQESPPFIDSLAADIQSLIEHIHIDDAYTEVPRKPGWQIESQGPHLYTGQHFLGHRASYIQRMFPWMGYPEEVLQLTRILVDLLLVGKIVFLGIHVNEYSIPKNLALFWNTLQKTSREISKNFWLIVQAGPGKWKFHSPGSMIDMQFDESVYEKIYLPHYQKEKENSIDVKQLLHDAMDAYVGPKFQLAEEMDALRYIQEHYSDKKIPAYFSLDQTFDPTPPCKARYLWGTVGAPKIRFFYDGKVRWELL